MSQRTRGKPTALATGGAAHLAEVVLRFVGWQQRPRLAVPGPLAGSPGCRYRAAGGLWTTFRPWPRRYDSMLATVVSRIRETASRVLNAL